VESSRSSSASSSTDIDTRWQPLVEAILGDPGSLSPAARAAIFNGDDPAELAALLEKVRRHAYKIVDRDVEGIDVDTAVEATLAAALGEALADRRRALEAIG
jgi:hypothetical protein